MYFGLPKAKFLPVALKKEESLISRYLLAGGWIAGAFSPTILFTHYCFCLVTILNASQLDLLSPIQSKKAFDFPLFNYLLKNNKQNLFIKLFPSACFYVICSTKL